MSTLHEHGFAEQFQQNLIIEIDKVCLLVDPTTITKWCKCQSKELAKFVRNRVDKILSATYNQELDYALSNQNPADVAFRGITMKNCKCSSA